MARYWLVLPNDLWRFFYTRFFGFFRFELLHIPIGVAIRRWIPCHIGRNSPRIGRECPYWSAGREGTTLGQVHITNTLQWRHNERDGISNHRRHDCLLSRLFRSRSKTSKFRVTGLCEGNSSVTGEFPAQRPVTWKSFPFDDAIISSPISQIP